VAISSERKQFIADIANDEWVDRLPADVIDNEKEFDRQGLIMQEKCDEFLRTCACSEELHEFAELFNWDTGCKDMMKLIENPACDRNTARLVFWLSGVQYYQSNFANRDAIEHQHDLDVWDLIQRITENVTSSWYKAALMSEDYKALILEDDFYEGESLWEIHPLMYGEK